MKKNAELFFTFLKIPIDYITLVAAGLLAYVIRYEESVQEIRPVIFDLPFERYFIFVLSVSAVWLLFFAAAGLYSFHRRKVTDELAKIVLACSTGMTAIIIYMFFVREYFSSRFIVLTAWVLSIFLIMLVRVIVRKIHRHTLKSGWGVHNIVIVGKNKNTEEIIDTFKGQPELGYKIIARIQEFDPNDKEDLLKLLKRKGIDEIVQTDSSLSRKVSIDLADFCAEHNIIFKYAAGQFEARTTNVEVHMIAGVPLIEIRKTKLDGWGKIIKRLIDFILSTFLIIVFSPIMILLTIIIRLEDNGPAIYKNERVHSKGTFNVFKFRSMYTKYCTGKQFEKYTNQKEVLEYEKKLAEKQSERHGPVYKILKDPRRTKIGRFMEKSSLDELPQLFNVWIGNMSLVGPRPHQPREVAKYKKHHKRVLDIKPGITGVAQISGRSDLDFDEEVKIDTYYIENWSLKLDFWVMLKTPFVVLIRKSRV
ncbi:sugar transferase [Candidatus Falkowbacteria bacterium]|jgi:exopolysaccharide biosynthesis polyprenyl glycosylphosphotransferase|nr:sugar transferase [Candidatus Falkowbacteria bacterium]MBT5503715.1 sugar transferase [Candidatus Falkowbacteria bacterium]MBT6573805.1 sugar transferase [Candidatus Falkowbacteria bacterium]MBT7348767.1 sugar transferase [Candidatus Falkowbacteria bacterium]MBT7500557.1 sugar transferase [Candidatus Falkowbacteria bacterium]